MPSTQYVESTAPSSPFDGCSPPGAAMPHRAAPTELEYDGFASLRSVADTTSAGWPRLGQRVAERGPEHGLGVLAQGEVEHVGAVRDGPADPGDDVVERPRALGVEHAHGQDRRLRRHAGDADAVARAGGDDAGH